MGRRRALLGPADVQDGVGEIDLIPTQAYKLGRPQAVAKGDKDHCNWRSAPALLRLRCNAIAYVAAKHFD